MASPMYRQIAEDLREQIESGQLAPGSQLPAELDLRFRHDASRNDGPGRDQVARQPRPGRVATGTACP